MPAHAIYPFYSGLFVPAKTPRAGGREAAPGGREGDPGAAVQARFATLGVEPMPVTLDQFDKFFREDVAAAVSLVKAAKIQTQ